MSYLKSLSRRDLLKTGVAAGSLLLIGGGFVAAPNAAWAIGSYASQTKHNGDAYPNGTRHISS